MSTISTETRKQLGDKLYEKRKQAALEIQKLVQVIISYPTEKLDFDNVKEIISILTKDYAKSANPSHRKGGLVGLAAVAAGLSSQADNEEYRVLDLQ